MFVISQFINALATVLDMLLRLYSWIIIIRALISWVNPDPYNPIVQFLYRSTEPVLRPIRRVIPPLGGIDISPLIALVAIYFIQIWLIPVLRHFAWQLGGIG